MENYSGQSKQQRERMAELTSPQRRAAIDALKLLRRANVEPEALLCLAFETPSDATTDSDLSEDQEPSPAILRASYIPPAATYFSEEELAAQCNKVTRKSLVSAVVDHPVGAVVEYPEAGRCAGESVAHRFMIEPSDFIHPRDNIQYSMGDKHGGRNDVLCFLLRNSVTNEPLLCKKRTYACNYKSFISIWSSNKSSRSQYQGL